MTHSSRYSTGGRPASKLRRQTEFWGSRRPDGLHHRWRRAAQIALPKTRTVSLSERSVCAVVRLVLTSSRHRAGQEPDDRWPTRMRATTPQPATHWLAGPNLLVGCMSLTHLTHPSPQPSRPMQPRARGCMSLTHTPLMRGACMPIINESDGTDISRMHTKHMLPRRDATLREVILDWFVVSVPV